MKPPSCCRNRLTLGACLLAGAMLSAFVAPAGAVPIPWKNCGKPSDSVQVQQLDASVWPTPIAVSLAATATIDPGSAQLTKLRLSLGLGVDWLFDSGSVPTGLRSGSYRFLRPYR